MVTLSPPQREISLRTSKEDKRHGFPEHLKHADLLGDAKKYKFSSSNGLFHAVLKGRVKGTKFLLDHNVSVNSKNDYGFNVLIAALHIDDAKKRRKMFQLLMRNGADPFFKDATHGRSVLHWACVLGCHEQVEDLLQELAGEVDLGDKDADGYTALHHAVMGGHLELVRTLVEMHRKFGVSVDVADKLGLTPYLHAKRLGHREVAAHLQTMGHASQGHGDLLFRSPREWSQIGKFERQRALERHTRDAVNLAKIKGKVNAVRYLAGSSPPRAGHKISVVSSCPAEDTSGDPKLPAQAARTRVSTTSLPTLPTEVTPEEANGRPSSAGGGDLATGEDQGKRQFAVKSQGHNFVASSTEGTMSRRPFPPRLAFGDEAASPPSWTVEASSNYLAVPARNTFSWAQSRQVPSYRRGSTVQGALSLLQMDSKGKHVQEFRHSQFDTSKADEYQHILGNLNHIMNILSQQQSKSFRQSVRYQRPETPKMKKSRNKVSSLAIILGRDKKGLCNKQRLSSNKMASAARKAEGKAKDKAATSGHDKKSVPKLKVNDRPL